MITSVFVDRIMNLMLMNPLLRLSFNYTLLNNTRASISIEEIVAKVKVAVGSNNQQKPQFGKIAGLKDDSGTFFFITK